MAQYNLAVEVIRAMNLSVLTVHYENYDRAYTRTVDQLLEFLGQRRENDLLHFKTGKTYRDLFFDNKIQHKTKRIIKEIASEETWVLLRGYFTTSRDGDETHNQL